MMNCIFHRLQPYRGTVNLSGRNYTLSLIYAIIKLHLAKEEENYLPILEARLPAEEVDGLVEAMEGTVTQAKSSLKMIDPRE